MEVMSHKKTQQSWRLSKHVFCMQFIRANIRKAHVDTGAGALKFFPARFAGMHAPDHWWKVPYPLICFLRVFSFLPTEHTEYC